MSEADVRRVVRIQKGDDYSTREVRSAQRALFDLGVFDTVSVVPDLDDKHGSQIPLKVTVTESKLRRVLAGPGVLIDPLRNDIHLLLSWEDRSFLKGLRQLKTEVRPMVMLKPGLTNANQVRPGFSTSVNFRQPSFIEARTTGTVGATTGILPDPANDFRMFSTRASVGVDRRFGPLVYLGFFYRKGWDFPYAYDNAQIPANVYRAEIGYFELLTSVDSRDDLMRTRRGYYAAASIQYAMAGRSFFQGDFGDLRLQPEIRLFGPLARGVTLAFRFLAGFLLPRNYGVFFPSRRSASPDNPSTYENTGAGEAPLWRAFYSGGASSNRGYPTRQIGLRDCAQNEVGSDCSLVIGGASVWESSLEVRFDIIGDLSGVLFLDASDLSRNRFDIRLDYPHLSAGPGLRYFTPIGPVRMDFGWRIPGAQRLGAPLDPREQPREFSFGIHGPFALHLSIGEAF